MDEKSKPAEQTVLLSSVQPGEVITSDNNSNLNKPPQVVGPAPITSEPVTEHQNNGVQPESSPHSAKDSEAVSWSASEFIAHHKSFGWYSLLGLTALVVAFVVWLLTKDVFSSGLVFVGVLLLGVYGAHKPRQLTYSLNNLGITIGSMHHTFSEFRSFSVVSEGAFASIELVPLRRFAMYTTVYFDPADEDKIISVLSTHLPMEQPRNDLVEQLMRRVRF